MIADIDFKKLVPLIIILLMVFCFRLDSDQFFQFGLKGGINLSSYIGKGNHTSYWAVGSDDNGIKPGIILGVYAIHYLKDKYSLQIELLYIQKGAYVSFHSVSYGSGEYYKMINSWEGTQSLTYFELLVLLKFLNIPRLPLKSMSYFGVSLSSLYNAKAKYDFKFIAQDESGNITDQCSEKDVSYDIYHTIKPVDIEIIAGITIPFKRIWFDFRYSISILPINQIGSNQIRNNSISVTFSLPFN
ncbi:MAG: porin family protein [Candidatus Celaenobacter antarcticus]|nr:porin family protein [Candidatus Celaenobacter antarcticus]